MTAESPAMARMNAQLARNAHAGREMDRANRTVMSARTNGLMAMLAPGWRVWAKESGTDARMDSDGEGRGGVIVETTGNRTVTADGELADSRAFRTVDPTSGARATLAERHIDVERIMGFDRVDTWRCIGLLARQLADATAPRRGRRRGLLEGEGEHRLLDLAADIGRLAAVCTVTGRAA